jgi:hypothetical protein
MSNFPQTSQFHYYKNICHIKRRIYFVHHETGQTRLRVLEKSFLKYFEIGEVMIERVKVSTSSRKCELVVEKEVTSYNVNINNAN